MNYLIVIFISYLLGSSSMSYYISRIKNVDITKKGSGNLGASNTILTIGWKEGIIVLIHDFLKAIIAVLIAKIYFNDLMYAQFIAGVCCVLGHIFPFYLKGKGGKGLACYIAMCLTLDFKFAICLILAVLLILVITDYIVIGTFTSMIVVPIYFSVMNQDIIIGLLLTIVSIVMLFKHLDNIKRLMNGTEIGFRSSNKGEHRAK